MQSDWGACTFKVFAKNKAVRWLIFVGDRWNRNEKPNATNTSIEIIARNVSGKDQ